MQINLGVIFSISILGFKLFNLLLRIFEIIGKKFASSASGHFWEVYQILEVYQTGQ